MLTPQHRDTPAGGVVGVYVTTASLPVRRTAAGATADVGVACNQGQTITDCLVLNAVPMARQPAHAVQLPAHQCAFPHVNAYDTTLFRLCGRACC